MSREEIVRKLSAFCSSLGGNFSLLAPPLPNTINALCLFREPLVVEHVVLREDSFELILFPILRKEDLRKEKKRKKRLTKRARLDLGWAPSVFVTGKTESFTESFGLSTSKSSGPLYLSGCFPIKKIRFLATPKGFLDVELEGEESLPFYRHKELV